MWMYAFNTQSNSIAFIMNNLIRRNRQGIMAQNSQQNFKIKTHKEKLLAVTRVNI